MNIEMSAFPPAVVADFKSNQPITLASCCLPHRRRFLGISFGFFQRQADFIRIAAAEHGYHAKILLTEDYNVSFHNKQSAQGGFVVRALTRESKHPEIAAEQLTKKLFKMASYLSLVAETSTTERRPDLGHESYITLELDRKMEGSPLYVTWKQIHPTLAAALKERFEQLTPVQKIRRRLQERARNLRS